MKLLFIAGMFSWWTILGFIVLCVAFLMMTSIIKSNSWQLWCLQNSCHTQHCDDSGYQLVSSVYEQPMQNWVKMAWICSPSQCWWWSQIFRNIYSFCSYNIHKSYGGREWESLCQLWHYLPLIQHWLSSCRPTAIPTLMLMSLTSSGLLFGCQLVCLFYSLIRGSIKFRCNIIKQKQQALSVRNTLEKWF